MASVIPCIGRMLLNSFRGYRGSFGRDLIALSANTATVTTASIIGDLLFVLAEAVSLPKSVQTDAPNAVRPCKGSGGKSHEYIIRVFGAVYKER